MKTKFTGKNGTEFIVREVKKTDAKAMLRYINEIVEEAPPGLTRRRKKYTLKREQDFVNSHIKLRKKQSGIIILAEKDKKVVALCDVSVYLDTPDCDHFRAFGISITKEHRGKGLGSFMIKETINLIKNEMPTIEVLEIDVTDNNMGAYKLYKKLGFKRVAKVPKRMKRDGKYISDITMQYYL